MKQQQIQGNTLVRLNTDLFNQRIAAGVNHCLAIGYYDTYQLYGWGSNEYENLGQAETTDPQINPSPVRIKLQRGEEEYIPIQVAVGNAHSLVLAYPNKIFQNLQTDQADDEDLALRRLQSDCTVIFSNGSNQFGQLGREKIDAKQDEPDEEDEEDEEDENEEDEEVCFHMTQLVESISKIIQITCGSNFSIAMDNYGQIYSWGEEETGCLGNGSSGQGGRKKPFKIDFEGIRMKFVNAGPAHVAALSEGGDLWTWGKGDYGQLGMGTNCSSNIPQLVNCGSVQGKQVDYVSCGAMHTACVTSDGFAHTFGFNKNGQLGTGNYTDRWMPGKVNAIQNFFVCYVKCGGNTTFVFTYERMIYAFGSNQKGRLGIKDELGQNYPDPIKLDQYYFKNKQQFIYQMALTYHYGLALQDNGKIISWGLPFKGCLGRDLQAELLPKVIGNEDSQLEENLKNIEDDADDDGIKLQDMFMNVKPETLQQLIEPKILDDQFVSMKSQEMTQRLQKEIQASQQIVEVKCGAFHTVALTDAGELWVWGSNPCMQHGMKNNEIKEQINSRFKYINFTAQQTIQIETLPTQVPQFTIRANKRITYFSVGFEYVVVVENRRNIYSWGKNDKGQCGVGFVSDFIEQPTKLEDMEGQLIRMVACGEDHTVILNDEGYLFAFGNPADGKLGIGVKQSFVLQAQQIPNISVVNKVCVGPHHTMALVLDTKYNERIIMTNANRKKEADNSLKYAIYTWGSGYGGKLGHSNMENQYYPKLLQTKYTFKDISAGTNHSGALSSDDRLIVWGIGAYLGISKPEEDDTQPQKVRKGREIEVEPYYILTPISHPELASKQFKEICLFDKYNMALTKQSKIQYWGLFETKFAQDLKREMQGKSESQKERIIESLLGTQSAIQQDIQYSKLSCSFNHAYAISVNQIDGVEKRDLYTWGYDGMTGRLGVGYEFVNPEKENEVQLDQNKKQEIVINQGIKNVELPITMPIQLQFINQYLDFSYKQYLLQIEQANKQDEDEQEEEVDDDEKSKMSHGRKSMMNQKQEGLQLGKSAKAISERVMIAQRLGIVEKGVVFTKSQEQFLAETKPEIFKCASARNSQHEETEEVSVKKKIKVNFFDENVVDEIYEGVYEVEQENINLFKQIRDVYLQDYKNFKDECKLTIINKIQREPFNVKFSNKEKKDEKKRSPLKKKRSKSPNKREKKQEEVKHDPLKPYTVNSYVYKVLFTILQMHPCYLLNMYQNVKNINKSDFVDLVKDVYGQMQNQKRKYRLYISLACSILKIDLKKLAQDPNSRLIFNYDEQDTNCLYTFTRLFCHFQKQFSTYVSANQVLIDKCLKLIESSIYQGTVPKLLKNIALVFLPRHLENDEISKPNIDPQQYPKFFDERVTFITDSYFPKVIESTFEQRELPKPVREILIKAYDIVKPFFLQKSTTLETIQCKMLGLYFLNFQISFMKVVTQQDSLRSNDEKVDSRIVNASCFIELFSMFINNESKEQDEQWFSRITDFISLGSSRRVQFFNQLLFQSTQLKTMKIPIFSETKKLKDIYSHSLELNDDTIQPTLKSITFATKLIHTNLKDIIYIKAQDQDILCLFNQKLDKNINYIKIAPEDPKQRVNIKLKSRQLLYTKKSLVLKYCHRCTCYAIESFMQSEDPLPYTRFNQWNPVSLAALLIAIVPCFKNKKDFDDFISGSIPDVSLFLKKKIAIQKEANAYANILKIKEFEKAFNEKVKFNIDQSDEVTDDSKQQIMKENKKVLRELRTQIQERLIQIYIYVYTMERNMSVLDKISKLLHYKIDQYVQPKKLLYQRILANCYFGMANKELIKPLVSNPVSMVSQIKDAIRKISTSQEIYENIDVFKQNSQTPCSLRLFGTYSLPILKKRQIIEKIDFECLELVKKQTQQIVTDEKIQDRILYIIQYNEQTNNVQGIIIYSEQDLALKQTLTCGIIKPPFEPIEFILDEYEIETSQILEMRKTVIQSVTNQTQAQNKRIGKYTWVIQKGFMSLLDELLNHAVIYDHIYQEPEQSKKKN